MNSKGKWSLSMITYCKRNAFNTPNSKTTIASVTSSAKNLVTIHNFQTKINLLPYTQYHILKFAISNQNSWNWTQNIVDTSCSYFLVFSLSQSSHFITSQLTGTSGCVRWCEGAGRQYSSTEIHRPTNKHESTRKVQTTVPSGFSANYARNRQHTQNPKSSCPLKRESIYCLALHSVSKWTKI